MSVTIAELNSRTLIGLGSLPPEWIALHEVHAAVVQILSSRITQARDSDTNVLLSRTKEFSATVAPLDITSQIGDGSEAFVETAQSGGGYLPIRIVNVAQLSEARDSGESVCAIWGEETDAGVRRFIQFSFAPAGAVRLHFDRGSVAKNFTESVKLPEAHSELVVLEAQNFLIPRISLKISLNQARLDIDPQILKLQLAALSAIAAQNNIVIPRLEANFYRWAFRPNANQQKTRRPIPSGRNFYG